MVLVAACNGVAVTWVVWPLAVNRLSVVDISVDKSWNLISGKGLTCSPGHCLKAAGWLRFSKVRGWCPTFAWPVVNAEVHGLSSKYLPNEWHLILSQGQQWRGSHSITSSHWGFRGELPETIPDVPSGLAFPHSLCEGVWCKDGLWLVMTHDGQCWTGKKHPWVIIFKYL